MSRLIDIIIPCYNSHKTIKKLLNSIVCQTLNVKDYIGVILVDDCSEQDYEYLKPIYKDQLPLTIIRLPERISVGLVRQRGIEESKAQFIMFADSDDQLYDCMSLENLLLPALNHPKQKFISGQIMEYRYSDTKHAIINPDHGVWVFGSLYNRNWIVETGIHFPDSSNNEDVYFMQLVSLSPWKGGETLRVETPVYLWTDANSEGRISNPEFKKLKSSIGWSESMANGLLECERLGYFKTPNAYQLIHSYIFMRMYISWLMYNKVLRNGANAKEFLKNMKIVYDKYTEYYGCKLTEDFAKEDFVTKELQENMNKVSSFGEYKALEKKVSFEEYLNIFDNITSKGNKKRKGTAKKK